jgi:ankyrin repeat protein
LAALHGDLEVFENIHKQQPVVSVDIIQPFHLAARRGNVAILQYLLDHAKDKKALLAMRTPKLLVERNRNRYYVIPEPENACPLHLAVYAAQLEATEILLRAGADLEARDELGLTALQLAVNDSPRKDMLELLLGAGANLNTRCNDGLTPLMRASRNRNGQDMVEHLIAITKDALDVQATDSRGWSALYHAIECRQIEVTKPLIQAGLNPLQMDLLGITPLQKALERNLEHFVLENLPEVDTVRSETVGSILNAAVYTGRDDVVSELLKKAPEKDLQEYINLSCNMGTPLYCAAARGNIKVMEKLFEKGAQIDLVGGPKGSPLMIACAMGFVDAVAWLLRKGAELQCTKFDETMTTAEEAAQQHEAILLVLRRFKENVLT